MVLTLGARLGAYEILGALGAGGMGEVYRARDTKLGRDVAIKVLPASFGADPDRLARFEREARLLASLNHPHIGAIYGVEESAGMTALVLELVNGDTLAQTLARRSGPRAEGLGLSEALAIARQIADALDAAHERGIVHRDLKPANIIITHEGVVKVLDFGLAKAGGAGRAGEAGWVDEGMTHSPTVIGPTMQGVLLGTAPYMSPEQARGKAVDKRTDIWAFGCVLYEMLAGRRAFTGETTTDALAAILEREPDWSALPDATPSHVHRLLERCLDKDPKRRLRDIADARVDLDDTTQAKLAPPTVAPSRTRREIVAWRLVAALSLAAAGALVWDRRPSSEAEEAPRITRAVRLTKTPAQEFAPAISPDGKWVAYYSDARGSGDVWVKYLETGAMLNLTASLNLSIAINSGVGSLDISPDGALIAFAARQSAEGNLPYDTWVIPAPVGGSPRKLWTGVQGARWSPDGKRLVAVKPGANLGDTLMVANADGTNQRVLVPLSGGRHLHWPAWSPDGKYVYFIHTIMSFNDEPSDVYRVAADGGEPEPVVQTSRRALYPAPMRNGGLIFAANPTTEHLGLWWQPRSGGAPRPLTSGVDEHTEAYLSPDGRRVIATLVDKRQTLVTLPVHFDAPVEPHRLTDGYTGDRYPVSDPPSGRIAFSSSRSGSRNLWLTRIDGSQPTPLTSGPSIDERPAFSPKGDQVAFVSERGGRHGIWVVNTDGGAPRFVGAAIALDVLTWSPDGTRIVFAMPGPTLPKLAAISVAGGLTTPFPTPAAAHSPSWSPVTNEIAYLEPSEPPPGQGSRTWLAFVDAQGRRLYPDLPRPKTFQNGVLAWSPDGTRVAVVSSQVNSKAEIWIAEPRVGRLDRLVELAAGVRVRGITWTPDGSAVIVSQLEEMSDLVLFELSK